MFSVIKYSLAVGLFLNKQKKIYSMVVLMLFTVGNKIHNLPLGYQRGYNLNKTKRLRNKTKSFGRETIGNVSIDRLPHIIIIYIDISLTFYIVTLQ